MTALRAIEQYDGAQDSGIEWLGDIPAHWRLKRLKFVVDIVKRIAGKEGFDVLSITQKGIKVKDVESGEGQLAMDYSKYQFLYKGEFAMNHMDLLTGFVDISQNDGVVSPDYRVFRNRSSEVLDAYLLLIFQMGYTQRIFYKYGQGVSFLGRWRFPADNFYNFFIPIPSLEEQKAIVDFVSKKSALIDEAIDIKEKEIALLNERKQIIVKKAVTQGLSPNVPMRDSGVDWVGEIPEHWDIKALKFVSFLQSGETLSPDNFTDEGYPVYGGNGFRGYTSKYTNEGEHPLVGRQGALCGNVNYAKGKFYASEHAIVVYPLNGENVYWLGETIKVSNLNRFSQSAAQPGIAVSVIKDVRYPYPPVEEQNEIAEFIGDVEEKTAAAIEELKCQIEKLKEYRATLINNAVTGKIRVPSKEA